MDEARLGAFADEAIAVGTHIRETIDARAAGTHGVTTPGEAADAGAPGDGRPLTGVERLGVLTLALMACLAVAAVLCDGMGMLPGQQHPPMGASGVAGGVASGVFHMLLEIL